jgi:hypothetical protein
VAHPDAGVVRDSEDGFYLELRLVLFVDKTRGRVLL